MKRILLVALVLAAMMPKAMAQDIDDRAAYHFNIDHDLWWGSSNAAGLAHSQMKEWRNVALGYDFEAGKYTDSWGARNQRAVSAFGDMFMDLEGFKIAAKVDLGLDRLGRNKYNTSLYEVSWDMPYFAALNSDETFVWRRSHASLDVSGATPLMFDDLLSFGLKVKLDLKGAKKSAVPICNYSGLSLEIMPSATFAVSDEHIVGLSAGYKFNPSKSILTSPETPTSVAFLRGLGTYQSRVVGGVASLGPVKYSSGAVAIAADYNYKGDASDWLVEITFDSWKTTVNEEATQTGAVDKFLTGLSAKGVFGEKRNNILSFKLNHNLNYWLSGVNETPSATNNMLDGSLFYTAYTSVENSGSFDWVFGFGSDFNSMSLKRFFPDGSFKTTHIIPSVFVGKNIKLEPEQSLLVKGNLGYNIAIGSSYRYEGNILPTDFIINYMFDDELDYLKSYCLSVGAEADYTYRLNSLLTPYASLGTSLLAPMGGVKGVRFLLSFKLGVLF